MSSSADLSTLTSILEQLVTLQRQQESAMKANSEALQRLVESRLATTEEIAAFNPQTELWEDYKERFDTYFAKTHAEDSAIKAAYFLSCQSAAICKEVQNFGKQQNSPKEVYSLTWSEICDFMKKRFDPKKFVVRERYKFWSNIGRKPNDDSIAQLAERIKQEAAMCDFKNITNPLDEALRMAFICSVNNESVLQAIFEIPDDQLTFEKAVEVAMEIEEADKAAKEIVAGYNFSSNGSTGSMGHKSRNSNRKGKKHQANK